MSASGAIFGAVFFVCLLGFSVYMRCAGFHRGDKILKLVSELLVLFCLGAAFTFTCAAVNGPHDVDIDRAVQLAHPGAHVYKHNHTFFLVYPDGRVARSPVSYLNPFTGFVALAPDEALTALEGP